MDAVRRTTQAATISATFQVTPSTASEASFGTTTPALSATDIQELLVEETTNQQSNPSAVGFVLLAVSEHSTNESIMLEFCFCEKAFPFFMDHVPWTMYHDTNLLYTYNENPVLVN